MCEGIYFIDLRFPKKAFMEIVTNEDKEAMWKLVLECLNNYMEECVAGCDK